MIFQNKNSVKITKILTVIILKVRYKSEKKIKKWERSSVWLERLPVTQEVASSSLVVPAI